MKTSIQKKRVQHFNHGTSRTKQQFKEECDINNILAGFEKTGAIEHQNKHSPQYGEHSSLDFQQAQEVITKASTMFEDLPATIRLKFDNDPSKFLDFAQNADNLPEMVEMGLATKNLDLTPPEPSKPLEPDEAKPEDGD